MLCCRFLSGNKLTEIGPYMFQNLPNVIGLWVKCLITTTMMMMMMIVMHAGGRVQNRVLLCGWDILFYLFITGTWTTTTLWSSTWTPFRAIPISLHCKYRRHSNTHSLYYYCRISSPLLFVGGCEVENSHPSINSAGVDVWLTSVRKDEVMSEISKSIPHPPPGNGCPLWVILGLWDCGCLPGVLIEIQRW